jgi:hypothetical protein
MLHCKVCFKRNTTFTNSIGLRTSLNRQPARQKTRHNTTSLRNDKGSGLPVRFLGIVQLLH